MARFRGCLSLTLAIAVAWSAPAWADDDHLGAARHAIEQLDYDKARAELDKALASGTYGPDELGEIYLLTGIVASSLGDGAAGVKAFERLLALSPKAKLVAGTSPKIRKRFAVASAFYKEHASLTVTVETSPSPPSVTLVIAQDPLGMVTGARVVVASAGRPDQTLTGTGHDRIQIALPTGRRLEIRAYAVDEAGNRLVELGGPSAPIVIDAPKPAVRVAAPAENVEKIERARRATRATTGEPDEPRPIYAAWWLWGAGAVGFAGAATYFGLAARSEGTTLQQLEADSTHHNFGEAEDTLTTARRDALLANIGFGVAGGLAVVTALFVMKGHGHRDAHAMTIAPTAVPGGSAITVAGWF